MTRTNDSARSAIVTGAASGIGAATAALLLEQGWRVALLDLPGKGLDAARELYASRTDVLVAAVDVTDEPAVDHVVDRVERAIGPIHGVVNSAGIAADIPSLETPVDLFRRILDVNVIGTFVVGRASARRMAERKSGAIVNIASVSGLRGSKGRVAYGSSKGGVITLTQVMANDLAAHGIRVNAVAPGPVDTPMVQVVHTPADRALWKQFIPMNRYAEPAEIAHAAAFLLDGTQAGYITGVVLPVDGGFAGAGVIARGKG
jgi:NAD(P)-dependent dehydrogenase (short-subunit alcohol dehydrogenase family)